MEPFSDFRVYTPTQLASILGVSVHRVRHVLDTRSNIRPAVTVNTKRFYRPHVVAMIWRELNVIDARNVA